MNYYYISKVFVKRVAARFLRYLLYLSALCMASVGAGLVPVGYGLSEKSEVALSSFTSSAVDIGGVM